MDDNEDLEGVEDDEDEENKYDDDFNTSRL